MAEAKRARRMALVAAAGGVEPLGTGSACADCGAPRTALNTGVCWSDAAKTRLTFHSAACDACRSARACQRLREDPAAKPVQMVADAAAPSQAQRDVERRFAANAPPEPEAQYWITDGVYGAFNAIIYDGWLPHAVVVGDPRRANGAGGAGGAGAGAALTTVFGPTCDSLDVVFSRVRNAPPMRRDDWLLFPCCGAYTSAGAADFNGIPATAAAGVQTRYVRSGSMRCTADDDALGLPFLKKSQ